MPRKATEFKWEHPKTLVETAKRLPKRLRWALAPFEWLADWTLYGFDRVALIRLTVQSVLAVSIVGGVIALALDLSDRDDERLLRAWKVLSDAKAGGNFGQKNAIQFLHNKGQSLQKIILRDAALTGIDRRGADLRQADLTGADLWKADLSGAHLGEGDLTGAGLTRAILRAAILRKADLGEADLGEADLRGANLGKANLRGPNLTRANLKEANLSEATLAGVKYCRTTIPDGTLRARDCKRP